jgi:hypothetical protein
MEKEEGGSMTDELGSGLTDDVQAVSGGTPESKLPAASGRVEAVESVRSAAKPNDPTPSVGSPTGAEATWPPKKRWTIEELVAADPRERLEKGPTAAGEKRAKKQKGERR